MNGDRAEHNAAVTQRELMVHMAVLALFTAIIFLLCVAAIAATLGLATGIGPIEGIIRVFNGLSKFVSEVFSW